MTFATKVKSEISHNKGLIARNKKAFSYGMLLCGKSFSEQSISMTSENKYIAKLYAKLIFQQIPMQTSVTTREYIGNFQQSTFAVSVDDEEDRKTILSFFGHQERENGCRPDCNWELLEDPEHRHAFLAGAFLSCSNISDTKGLSSGICSAAGADPYRVLRVLKNFSSTSSQKPPNRASRLFTAKITLHQRAQPGHGKRPNSAR